MDHIECSLLAKYDEKGKANEMIGHWNLGPSAKQHEDEWSSNRVHFGGSRDFGEILVKRSFVELP